MYPSIKKSAVIVIASLSLAHSSSASNAFGYSWRERARSQRTDSWAMHVDPILKDRGLSLKMLAKPQVTGPCLASLLGTPNEANHCLQWVANVDAAPTADHRRLIYVGAGDNFLHVLDGDTGLPFAQIATQGRVTTKILWNADSALMFFGTDKGVVSAHDPFTFAKIFSFQADGTINNDLMLDGDSLMFSSGLATIFRIDSKTGKEQWRILRPLDTNKLMLTSNSNMILFKDKLDVREGNFLVAGHPEGYISVIYAPEGPEEMRTIRLEGLGSSASFPDIVAPMLYIDGLLWVASFGMGIFILDPENGQIRNRLDVIGVSQLAFDGKRVYGATGKELLAFSSSGEIIWRTVYADLKTRDARYGFPFSQLRWGAKKVFMGVPSTLVLMNDKLVMATSQGAMGEFNPQNGTLQRVVGNSLGFGPKIGIWGQGIMASTRRGLLALFQNK